MNTVSPPLIAPSLLSAKFSNMESAIRLIERSGADWIHFDVMDGVFVPDITFGHKMVADTRPLSAFPFDVHLMVVHPENQIQKIAQAGADTITIHVEAATHLHRALMLIREAGKKPGISLVPSTPPEQLKEILSIVDLVLVMTVNPGYGGQTLIDSTLEKVIFLREQREKMGYNYLIEIDGGVNRETYAEIRKVEPDVIVTGHAFFTDPDPEDYISLFKQGKTRKRS